MGFSFNLVCAALYDSSVYGDCFFSWLHRPTTTCRMIIVDHKLLLTQLLFWAKTCPRYSKWTLMATYLIMCCDFKGMTAMLLYGQIAMNSYLIYCWVTRSTVHAFSVFCLFVISCFLFCFLSVTLDTKFSLLIFVQSFKVEICYYYFYETWTIYLAM